MEAGSYELSCKVFWHAKYGRSGSKSYIQVISTYLSFGNHVYHFKEREDFKISTKFVVIPMLRCKKRWNQIQPRLISIHHNFKFNMISSLRYVYQTPITQKYFKPPDTKCVELSFYIWLQTEYIFQLLRHINENQRNIFF